jgi:hypothetical protein
MVAFFLRTILLRLLTLGSSPSELHNLFSYLPTLISGVPAHGSVGEQQGCPLEDLWVILQQVSQVGTGEEPCLVFFVIVE